MSSAPRGEEDLQSRIAEFEAELASVRRAHDLQTQARERAEHEREQYRKLYTLVLYELERLKRQLFGKKAESVGPAQVQLVFGPVFDALARAEAGDASAQADVEDELRKLREAADQAQDSEAADRGKRRKGHGRRDFDLEKALIETIVLEPPERLLPGGELLTVPGVCGCGVPESCSGLRSALVHRYRFQGVGATLVDSRSAANGQTNSNLTGTSVLELSGAESSSATLPAGLLSALSATTIEFWLTWQGGNAPQAALSFGTALPRKPSNVCAGSASFFSGSWYHSVCRTGPRLGRRRAGCANPQMDSWRRSRALLKTSFSTRTRRSPTAFDRRKRSTKRGAVALRARERPVRRDALLVWRRAG